MYACLSLPLLLLYPSLPPPVLFGYIFRRIRKIAKGDLNSSFLSMCVPMEQFGSHWMNFHENWYFLKICQENSSLTKIWQD